MWKRRYPGILEDPDAKLSGALRVLLAQLQMERNQLPGQIDEADAVIKQTAGENEACRRLVAIPGIGPVTATASSRKSAAERHLKRVAGSPPG